MKIRILFFIGVASIAVGIGFALGIAQIVTSPEGPRRIGTSLTTCGNVSTLTSRHQPPQADTFNAGKVPQELPEGAEREHLPSSSAELAPGMWDAIPTEALNGETFGESSVAGDDNFGGGGALSAEIASGEAPEDSAHHASTNRETDSQSLAAFGSSAPEPEEAISPRRAQDLPLDLAQILDPQEIPHSKAMADSAPESLSTPMSTNAPTRLLTAGPSPRMLVQPVAQHSEPSGLLAQPQAAAGTPSAKVIIEVDNEEIRNVLAMLGRQLGANVLVSRSVQGTITATLRDVDLESALEALLRVSGFVARRFDNYIFVGTEEECERLEQTRGGLGLRVYRPRFVSARELQSLLQPLITPSVGIITVSSPPETGIGADVTRVGGDSYAGGDVVIVRDYQSVLHKLDRLVAEVDVKPPQVAIEAMILAVRLDDEDRLGINFELFRDRPRFRLGWENPPATLADIRFDAGLKVAFLDGSVSSFVTALQQVRDTNVIAAPRLLVLNKHRAEIQIGKEQGYVSTTVTETAATQSVDFLDTGTLLRIRPFVLGDKMIRLEVHPELSDGEVRELAGFTVPQKDITQVTTNILVPHGATVVIGGLIRHELSAGGSQIPGLGSLPWIGALFRNRSAQQLREEIIVLITPHIVDDQQAWLEGLEAREQFAQRFAAASEVHTPLGRQNVARRFYRLAEAAWNRGDCLRARRMAELALHFDPQLEQAQVLREATLSRSAHCYDSRQGPSPRNTLPPSPSEEALPKTGPVFVLPREQPSSPSEVRNAGSMSISVPVHRK